jgi:RNase P/RNase MRP subunit p29
MKARPVALTLATFFVALTWCFGQDAMMGTWKLNEAKSKIGAGSPKNNTVVIEAAGENVKVTMDGVDLTGKPTHNEWTGKFDGKEYPVTGDANSDTRSYKKVDDRTFEVSAKKGSKVTVSGRVVVSADGKTRTAHAKGTSPSGEKFETTAVYDKQ